MARKNVEPRTVSDILKWILVMVLIFALTAAVWFTFANFLSINRGRAVLYEGKNAVLAARTVSMEYKAVGRKFSSVSTQSGFSTQAQEDVQKLCDLPGTVILTVTEADGYGVVCLRYERDGYLAQLGADGIWQVYEKSVLIAA